MKPLTDSRSSRSAILFEAVGKRFRRGRLVIEVLNGLSLSVEAGQVAALVGPNGSGKTTALRIAATLVSPSSGSCRVLGRDVGGDSRAVRRTIGVSLGSERSFYWRLTARQNLAFFAGIAGVGVERGRSVISSIAAELDIERFLSKPARQLSRGALARLAVARACLASPRVLVLDEPFASIDERGKELVRLALRRRAARGCAVLLATHDAAMAGDCDVVVELKTPRSSLPERSHS
jgi:ABC-2 type transport system ATP-binding protein